MTTPETSKAVTQALADQPKLPDLPAVPSDTPVGLKRFLEPLREYIQIIAGRRGSPLDTAVTFRDLVKTGVVDLAPGSVSLRDGTPSVSVPGVEPEPVDFTAPPAATGVTATGGYETIFIEWSFPVYRNYAYAEIFRADTNNISAAVKIGQSEFTNYVDRPGLAVTRYYWVRFVSKAGIEGPFHSSEPVFASTSIDVSATLNALTGQISTTQLDQALNGRYSVKVDSNGYVSGYGLFVNDNTAAPESAFIIRADNFAVANPGGSGIAPIIPFVVRTTPTTINGVPVPVGVYIDGAYIQGGTITGASIAGGSISNAKLIDVSANKITGAALQNTAYIESQGYQQGQSGWKISGNGVAEFAAAHIRGQLTASQIDSRGLSIRDANGNVILAAGTPLSIGNITGLGSLATQNSVAANQVSGLGGLATQDNVFIGSTVRFANGTVMDTGDFVNALSKIDSSNISTFISSAAIGNAYIGNLDAAKITTGTLDANRIATGSLDAKIANISAAVIGSGTFGSARIADGAITTAKIGDAQVNTLKIGTEAVTIPRGTSASNVVSFSNTTVTALSGAANFGGAPVIVTMTIEFQSGEVSGSGADTGLVQGAGTVRLKRGSTTLISATGLFGGGTSYSPVTLTFYDATPGSGSITYSIEVQGNAGAAYRSRSLSAIGAQR
jgi:hypothetical protein